MRIAFLSSGPSLTRFDPSKRFDLRIGINRAACVHACDWWSAGDAQAFWRHVEDRDNEKQGIVIWRPRVLTMAPTWAEVHNSNPALYNEFPEWTTWEKLRDLMLPPQEWDTFSSTAALVLCAYLGATEIVTFGVDMIGDADFAGFANGSRYNENDRWPRERRIWHRLIDWLGDKHIMVIDGSKELGGLAHAA